MTNLYSIWKSGDITLPTNVHICCPHCQTYGFSSHHVQMWQLDQKEGRAVKTWCFWIVVLEKTLESPLDSKIKPVNPKGNQSWILIGRTDAEAETPILWPPDVKSQLTRKYPDAGKDWDRRRRGWQRMIWLDGITNSFDMNLSRLWEIVKDRKAWHASVHGVTKSWTRLSDWTTATIWPESLQKERVWEILSLGINSVIPSRDLAGRAATKWGEDRGREVGPRVLICTWIWHFCEVNAKVAMDPLDDWLS